MVVDRENNNPLQEFEEWGVDKILIKPIKNKDISDIFW